MTRKGCIIHHFVLMQSMRGEAERWIMSVRKVKKGSVGVVLCCNLNEGGQGHGKRQELRRREDGCMQPLTCRHFHVIDEMSKSITTPSADQQDCLQKVERRVNVTLLLFEVIEGAF